MTMGQSSSPRSSPRLFVRHWHTRLSSQCRTTRPRLSTRLPITSQTTISVTATMTTICSHPTTTRTAPRITPTRTSPASAIIDSRGSLQTTSHIRSRTDTERSSRTSATTRVSSLSPLPSFHRTNPAARPPNSVHGRRHSGFSRSFIHISFTVSNSQPSFTKPAHHTGHCPPRSLFVVLYPPLPSCQR